MEQPVVEKQTDRHEQISHDGKATPDTFGPWMVVQRRQRRIGAMGNNQPQASVPVRSRFASLQQGADAEIEVDEQGGAVVQERAVGDINEVVMGEAKNGSHGTTRREYSTTRHQGSSSIHGNQGSTLLKKPISKRDAETTVTLEKQIDRNGVGTQVLTRVASTILDNDCHTIVAFTNEEDVGLKAGDRRKSGSNSMSTTVKVKGLDKVGHASKHQKTFGSNSRPPDQEVWDDTSDDSVVDMDTSSVGEVPETQMMDKDQGGSPSS